MADGSIRFDDALRRRAQRDATANRAQGGRPPRLRAACRALDSHPALPLVAALDSAGVLTVADALNGSERMVSLTVGAGSVVKWDAAEPIVYVATDAGEVLAAHPDKLDGLSWQDATAARWSTSTLHSAGTTVHQLDVAAIPGSRRQLCVSTQSECLVLDLAAWRAGVGGDGGSGAAPEASVVQGKARKGPYGACLLPSSSVARVFGGEVASECASAAEDSVVVVAARPGRRLWLASAAGAVEATVKLSGVFKATAPTDGGGSASQVVFTRVVLLPPPDDDEQDAPHLAVAGGGHIAVLASNAAAAPGGQGLLYWRGGLGAVHSAAVVEWQAPSEALRIRVTHTAPGARRSVVSVVEARAPREPEGEAEGAAGVQGLGASPPSEGAGPWAAAAEGSGRCLDGSWADAVASGDASAADRGSAEDSAAAAGAGAQGAGSSVGEEEVQLVQRLLRRIHLSRAEGGEGEAGGVRAPAPGPATGQWRRRRGGLQRRRRCLRWSPAGAKLVGDGPTRPGHRRRTSAAGTEEGGQDQPVPPGRTEQEEEEEEDGGAGGAAVSSLPAIHAGEEDPLAAFDQQFRDLLLRRPEAQERVRQEAMLHKIARKVRVARDYRDRARERIVRDALVALRDGGEEGSGGDGSRAVGGGGGEEGPSLRLLLNAAMDLAPDSRLGRAVALLGRRDKAAEGMGALHTEAQDPASPATEGGSAGEGAGRDASSLVHLPLAGLAHRHALERQRMLEAYAARARPRGSGGSSRADAPSAASDRVRDILADAEETGRVLASRLSKRRSRGLSRGPGVSEPAKPVAAQHSVVAEKEEGAGFAPAPDSGVAAATGDTAAGASAGALTARASGDGAHSHAAGIDLLVGGSRAATGRYLGRGLRLLRRSSAARVRALLRRGASGGVEEGGDGAAGTATAGSGARGRGDSAQGERGCDPGSGLGGGPDPEGAATPADEGPKGQDSSAPAPALPALEAAPSTAAGPAAWSSAASTLGAALRAASYLVDTEDDAAPPDLAAQAIAAPQVTLCALDEGDSRWPTPEGGGAEMGWGAEGLLSAPWDHPPPRSLPRRSDEGATPSKALAAAAECAGIFVPDESPPAAPAAASSRVGGSPSTPPPAPKPAPASRTQGRGGLRKPPVDVARALDSLWAAAARAGKAPEQGGLADSCRAPPKTAPWQDARARRQAARALLVLVAHGDSTRWRQGATRWCTAALGVSLPDRAEAQNDEEEEEEEEEEAFAHVAWPLLSDVCGQPRTPEHRLLAVLTRDLAAPQSVFDQSARAVGAWLRLAAPLVPWAQVLPLLARRAAAAPAWRSLYARCLAWATGPGGVPGAHEALVKARAALDQGSLRDCIQALLPVTQEASRDRQRAGATLEGSGNEDAVVCSLHAVAPSLLRVPDARAAAQSALLLAAVPAVVPASLLAHWSAAVPLVSALALWARLRREAPTCLCPPALPTAEGEGPVRSRLAGERERARREGTPALACRALAGALSLWESEAQRDAPAVWSAEWRVHDDDSDMLQSFTALGSPALARVSGHDALHTALHRRLLFLARSAAVLPGLAEAGEDSADDQAAAASPEAAAAFALLRADAAAWGHWARQEQVPAGLLDAWPIADGASTDALPTPVQGTVADLLGMPQSRECAAEAVAAAAEAAGWRGGENAAVEVTRRYACRVLSPRETALALRRGLRRAAAAHHTHQHQQQQQQQQQQHQQQQQQQQLGGEEADRVDARAVREVCVLFGADAACDAALALLEARGEAQGAGSAWLRAALGELQEVEGDRALVLSRADAVAEVVAAYVASQRPRQMPPVARAFAEMELGTLGASSGRLLELLQEGATASAPLPSDGVVPVEDASLHWGTTVDVGTPLAAHGGIPACSLLRGHGGVASSVLVARDGTLILPYHSSPALGGGEAELRRGLSRAFACEPR